MFGIKLRKDIKEKIDTLKPKVTITVKHVDGLEIEKNKDCQLYYCKDKIVIGDEETTYILKLEQINDIYTRTSNEISQEITSSVGGAVLGGLAFGTVGAIVGGRPKTKTRAAGYLLINFNNKNDKQQIVAFDITNCSRAIKFVELFRKSGYKKVKEKRNIEL